MDFLGGENGESCAKVETHLIAENRTRASSGAIGLFDTMVEHVAHQIQVRAIEGIIHSLCVEWSSTPFYATIGVTRFAALNFRQLRLVACGTFVPKAKPTARCPGPLGC